MTPAQVAHIMEMVNKLKRFSHPIDRHEAAEVVAEIEAALRDAPQQAEPTNAATTELLHASVIQRIWKKCKEEDMDIEAFAWRIQREAERAARPSAPTAVEPDERAMANELIKVAAWLLSPEPRRKLAELEDATHIGHRQFHRAYEGTFETLRLKAIEIRNFVDAARASKGTPK